MTRWSCIFSVGAPKNVAVAPFILQGRMGLDSGAESISVELWTLKSDFPLYCYMYLMERYIRSVRRVNRTQNLSVYKKTI